MKKLLIGVGVLVIASAIFLYAAYGGFGKPLEAPGGTPFVSSVPDDWSAHKQAKMAARDTHIVQHQIAYNRFADFAESETDGIPYIILKLLPVIAPEYWGEGDNFLSVMGLFFDERLPGAPVPRGMGFSGLSRVNPVGNIDYASFSCGACHIGRVRTEDNKFYYLDGGINAEFNVVGYRKRLVQTIDKIAGTEIDPAKRTELVTNKILEAIDQVHALNPNYFYKNFTYENRTFDAAYEQAQIDLFKKTAGTRVSQFIKHHEDEYHGWEKFVDKYYQGAQPQLLDGLPGMEDAIGFNTVKANANLKLNLLTKPFAFLALPPSHGVTDIMAVWEQNTHDPLWSEDKRHLINGGGQWTGHIPLPIYKNIAAQLTIGYDNVDVRVSAFAEEVLDKMPASVYPFDVDIALAKKGQALFAENCAACHQPHNGKVYNNLGTDMGRAKIAGLFVTLGAISGFTDVCDAGTVVQMYDKDVKPCAEYKGVSLKGKKSLAMTAPKQHEGYNALPLVGLWAQAPYLHNGSVPTLYHLLVPNERPAVFVKSRLDYDQKLAGFVWELDAAKDKNEGYEFDTRLSPAMSNRGHDTNIEQDGKTFKLNWADDKEGALALVEYLKIL
ncbi:hypothetical protein GCM10011613_05940 [Cellvibrio zantedeschiae]|uniref:Cytochrome c domain-containing protein n=1 Tax=Cellvibrio zantedeschiae TaxID=1237077 RepID=A0ABQ3AS75_9GAMM|nr:c-type cytochrome [Cellvibrio zantedeschiae]GGY64942.1 hypothetical protein GCM10011613_05940 [Cellvibrio zantedeschiae]